MDLELLIIVNLRERLGWARAAAHVVPGPLVKLSYAMHLND